MENELHQKGDYEQEIKKDKFPENFANVLNASAFVLISSIIIAFFFFIFSSINTERQVEKEIKIQFTPSNNTKLDSVKFNNIIDLKLKEFKEDIKNSEKERNENMKFYSALVGFILSIVGFFGFKSIHDTRQSAIESVKIKAGSTRKVGFEKVYSKSSGDAVKTLFTSYPL